ncbi:hypothetical protein SUGI_0705650 [Cryptomeria japonica]|nr:hypothetical protein SUGI_0705650 [Cryptomeria japonica]
MKRLRNDDNNGIDSLERQLLGAELEYGFKRFCSNNRGSVILSLDYEQNQEVVAFTSNGDCLREKTADSESCSSMVYYDTQLFLPPFFRINVSAPILGSLGPDDAQSSTSDSSCCCCHTSDDDDVEGGGGRENDKDHTSSSSLYSSASNQSIFNYLSQASDDDLGLPPVICIYDTSIDGLCQNQSNLKEKHVETLDLDLDVADDYW